MLVNQLIPTLQVAIGPVVLISGIGLLILSMTNRFGRVIDRGRILARELAGVPAQDQVHIEAQLQILTRRAEYLRRAITAGTYGLGKGCWMWSSRPTANAVGGQDALNFFSIQPHTPANLEGGEFALGDLAINGALRDVETINGPTLGHILLGGKQELFVH